MTSPRLGASLLMVLSLSTATASAEPTQWLWLRLEPALARPPKTLLAPPLVAPQLLLSPTDAQLAALMAQRPALQYSPSDSSVTLSLEPGSCTGACLKVVGSF